LEIEIVRSWRWRGIWRWRGRWRWCKGYGDGEGDIEIGRQRKLREWGQRDKRKNQRRVFLRQYIDATMHLAPIDFRVTFRVIGGYMKTVTSFLKRVTGMMFRIRN
jgi:hypothetical protein